PSMPRRPPAARAGPVPPPPVQMTAAGLDYAAPPRPITPAARRRATVEPRVRFWWLAAMVLGAVVLWLAGTTIWEWSREADVIKNSTPVVATIDAANDSINEAHIPGKKMSPSSIVVLGFTLNGQKQQVHGRLTTKTDFVLTGDSVPIRVM